MEGTRSFVSSFMIGMITIVGLVKYSSAATIEVIESDSEPTKIVLLNGDISEGDDVTFLSKTIALEHAIVILKSPGGNLKASLSIGAQIRVKGFATVAPPGHLCASACALAWLGGTRRYMWESSRIGFHAAYIERGKFRQESGAANAVVGAYLNQLGLSLEAIRYITTPGPDEVQWLTIRDAIVLGINVESLEENGKSTPPPRTETAEATARRAARAFDRTYKQSGMTGINISIDACYKRAGVLRTEASARYCFILDFIASEMQRSAIQMLGVPENDFNKIESVNRRANNTLDALGLPSSVKGQRLSEWAKLGMAALLEIVEAKK